MVLSRHIQSWITEGISYFFIILFTFAAISKLLDYETFQLQLGQSPFISTFVGLLAWGVPTIEITISLLFFSSRLRLLAFYASTTIMVIYTTYIILVLNFADAIPCSCGGVIASLSWNEHLIFNIGWLLLAILGITLSYNTKEPKNINTRPFLNSKNEIIT